MNGMRRYVLRSLAGLATFLLCTQGALATRSIVACDPKEGSCGTAVVTFLAGAGFIVPAGEQGVAIANQANPFYGLSVSIMKDVKSGIPADEALNRALPLSSWPTWNQVAVAALAPSSPHGVGVATYSGSDVIAYALESCTVRGDTFAVIANTQTSAAVCDAMAHAFMSSTGTLARRLYKALIAGSAVGGDVRGEYAAAVRVYSDLPFFGGDWQLNLWAPFPAVGDVMFSPNWKKDLELSLNIWIATNTASGDPREFISFTPGMARRAMEILHRLHYYDGRISNMWNKEAEQALEDWSYVQFAWIVRPTYVVRGKRYIEISTAGVLFNGDEVFLVPNPAASTAH